MDYVSCHPLQIVKISILDNDTHIQHSKVDVTQDLADAALKKSSPMQILLCSLKYDFYEGRGR